MQGGTLHLHHQVRRIGRETVHGEQVLSLALSVWPTGRPLTVRARHVVLAMPQRSIELLDPDTFLFASDQFLSDLGSIVPRPASKLFLGYDRPWWEDLGLRRGRSVTDLPLRQTYYRGVEGKQSGADPANRNALLLASYNDFSDVEFWNELLKRPQRLAPVAVTRPPRPMDAAAPGTLVDEAQRQLRELHGPDARIPEPTSAYFQDWVQDPYGAAFHFWQVGAKSWEVMPRMRATRSTTPTCTSVETPIRSGRGGSTVRSPRPS
ncbi:FAD-dependent oxidoreductase [Streptomyces sp. NPDC055144]